MKICCISDLHGTLEGLDFKDAELVIIAGDFSKMPGFGKWHLHQQADWIKHKFIPFVSQFKEKQFVIVPGNHDLCLDPKLTAAYPDLDWKIAWPDNVHLLIDSTVTINGFKIYGSPWVPVISYRWAFEGEHDVLKEKFSKIPDDVDLLVTHSPPRIPGKNIDYSIQTQYGPFGSSELAQAIYDKCPKYAFCGHIHTGDHECIEFEKSKLYNVSRLNEDYAVAYEPLFLDVFKRV